MMRQVLSVMATVVHLHHGPSHLFLDLQLRVQPPLQGRHAVRPRIRLLYPKGAPPQEMEAKSVQTKPFLLNLKMKRKCRAVFHNKVRFCIL
mmetsp:Transcript_43119/g.69122  ORF Transcript_43119/g.69122 Transcript_43119/m.69122 type:complete len:91 (+) Transcript_43119:113-385(+)